MDYEGSFACIHIWQDFYTINELIVLNLLNQISTIIPIEIPIIGQGILGLLIVVTFIKVPKAVMFYNVCTFFIH